MSGCIRVMESTHFHDIHHERPSAACIYVIGYALSGAQGLKLPTQALIT